MAVSIAEIIILGLLARDAGLIDDRMLGALVLMALVTYALARRMVGMESAAERARELGSYNLLSRIGSGGMGEVWRARHRMLARDAAIKLIRNDLATGPGGPGSDVARRRF